MKTGWLVVGGGIVCAMLVGCAVEAGDDAAEASVLASSTQPLIAGWASGPFRWDQGQPPLLLESTSTHVCALSMISGRFAGTGESVKVTTSADGTRWVLTGSSAQNGVAGEAICFPKLNNAFVSNTSSRVVSEESVASAFSRGSGASQSQGGGCQQAQASLFLGSDFAFIEGMQGEMAGGGELGLAVPSPSQNTDNFLRSQICTAGVHNVFGRALRVSLPASRPAKFIDTDGFRGDLNTIGEFSVGGNVASASVKMARSAQALCAFTRIQGKFFGGGESVQIREEGEHWVLRTTKGAGSNFVGASARCFARNQN